MSRKVKSLNMPGLKKARPGCRVYVSNIPYEYKWQVLKDDFRKEVGPVSFVEIFEDDDGRSRGVGVVDMETPQLAELAIQKMNNVFEANGRVLHVRDEDDATNAREFRFLFSGSGGRRFPRDYSDGEIVGPTYGLNVQFLQDLGISGTLQKIIFVFNLPFQVTSADLTEAFKLAGKVIKAEVMKNEDGKSRGFGCVEYEHPIHAVQAISMFHRQMYFDRILHVRMDKKPEVQHALPKKLPKGLNTIGRGLGNDGMPILDIADIPTNTGGMDMGFDQMGHNQGYLGGNGGGYGSSGMNPMMNAALASNFMSNMASMMQRGGGTRNMSDRIGERTFEMEDDVESVVKIGNLPYDFTWQELKKLCVQYGGVNYVETPMNGVGLVRFSSQAGARRAAESLRKQRINGRLLETRLA